MDVIAMHAAGFENAVATLGTAITSEQARIFAKYTKKVIICYDSDNAGQNAAQKAIRLLSEVGVDVKVLNMAGAKDPDEYIKQYGVESFKKLLGESKNAFEHQIDKIIASHDISIADEKIRASADICLLIANINTKIEQEIYTRLAAKKLDVSEVALKADVERINRRLERERRQKESADAKLSIKNIGDRINVDAAKHIAANANEKILLALMLMYDEFRREAAGIDSPICADDFVTEFGRRVFSALCELENSESGYSRAMLGQRFSTDEIGRIKSLEVDRMGIKNDREVFESCIRGLKSEKKKLETEDDPFSDLMAKRAAAKKQRESEKK